MSLAIVCDPMSLKKKIPGNNMTPHQGCRKDFFKCGGGGGGGVLDVNF